MIGKFPPNVTHHTCTMSGGECIGCHCSKCGQGCSWQGHFGMCRPEDIAAYEAHKQMIASLAVTGRQLLADPDANIDALVLANLAEQYAQNDPNSPDCGEEFCGCREPCDGPGE